MANNYCQFSVQLNLKTTKEQEWWTNVLSVNEDSDPESNEAKLFMKVSSDPVSETYNFDSEVQDKTVWLYGEESGDPYEVAHLVHHFFKELRPKGKDLFVITWADTCSKMRLNEFGGGTIVATKVGVGCCSDKDQLEYATQNIETIE